VDPPFGVSVRLGTVSGVYRFLLKPGWLALTLLMVAAVPACVFMGLWQLGRFEDRVEQHNATEDRPHEAAEPLRRVLGEGSRERGVTGDDINRPVTVTGRWDVERQLLVPGRTLDGRDGYWVLTPVRPSGGGEAVPVVRGWKAGKPPERSAGRAAAAQLPEPARGVVTVRGYLRAPESEETPGAHPGTGLPEGQVGMVSGATLINVLPYPVRDAWVAQREAPAGLMALPPQQAEGSGLSARAFQNLGYTGEWFVFAGFAVFMWFRFVRREAEVRRDQAMGLDG
jgi:cytochrome oxidase assembly protein ShyY1